MQQYEIEFYGSGIDVMASAITNEQAEHIRKFLKIRAYDNIAQAEKELKYIGIDTSKADILNFYKMLYNDEVIVRVLNFDFEEILKFNLKDMAAAKDVIPDFDTTYNNLLYLPITRRKTKVYYSQ